MTRQRMMWVLIALWAAVGGLALYRQQNPDRTLDTLYTLIFAALFAISIIYLYLRMRRQPPQE